MTMVDKFLSDASFLTPDYMVHSTWMEHGPFAFWLTRALKPRVLVELGVFRGYSYFALNQAVAHDLLDTQCFGVDTWAGDEHGGVYGEDIFLSVRDHNELKYKSQSTLIRSTFNEAVQYFADGSIDLLHIDGRHFEEDVREDYETWLPKLSDRAVVLFHDTNIHDQGFGVYKLWAELKARHPHFEFPYGCGLGVLGVGRHLPPEIRGLFEASSEERALIQRAYSTLGSGVRARFDADTQTAHARWLERTTAAEKEDLVQDLERQKSVAEELRCRLETEREALAKEADRQTETMELLQARVACEQQAMSTEQARQKSAIGRLWVGSTLAQAAMSEELDRQGLAASRVLTRLLLKNKAMSNELDRQKSTARSLRSRLDDAEQSLARAQAHAHRLEAFRAQAGFASSRERFGNLNGLSTGGRRFELVRKKAKTAAGIVEPFFWTDWYLEQHPEAAASGLTAIQHYLTIGEARGFDPNPAFKSGWYSREYRGELQGFDGSPFVHFILYGANELREPNPRRDFQTYVAAHGFTSGLEGFTRYLAEPPAPVWGDPSDEAIIRPFFDEKYYLEENSEAALNGMDALKHYLIRGEALGANPNRAFDVDWYRNVNTDVRAGNGGMFAHFIRYGANEMREPNSRQDFRAYVAAHGFSSGLEAFARYLAEAPELVAEESADQNAIEPYFEEAWYLEQNPEVAQSGLNALEHYLTIGEVLGYAPNRAFDVRWYRSANSDVGTSGANLFAHFIRYGANELREPNPRQDFRAYAAAHGFSSGREAFARYLAEASAAVGEEPSDADLIRPYFDEALYLEQNPEIEHSGRSALEHYLAIGEVLDCVPNRAFDVKWYRSANPDVGANDANLFAHFIRYGANELREPNPRQDFRTYVAAHDFPSGLEAFARYLAEAPSVESDDNVIRPYFDEAWYLEQHPEVAASGQGGLKHYLAKGEALGYDPNPAFSVAWYRNKNSDVVADGNLLFPHFIRFGANELRTPNPRFDIRFYAFSHELTSGLEAFSHYLREHQADQPIAADQVSPDEANALMGDPSVLTSPMRVVVGIVLSNNTSEQIRRIVQTTKMALSRCPFTNGGVSIFDNGSDGAFLDESKLPAEVALFSAGRQLGFGNGHNALMADAFSKGADVYIAANPDGAFHPDCITHLLAMNVMQQGDALLEAVQFPEEHPKFYSPCTLETAWISGACFLMPRKIWEATGGFDPNIFLYCEDVDLSWEAHYHGFKTLTCPKALFYHDVSGRGYSAWRYREMLISGRYLGYKWGSPEFMEWAESELVDRKFALSVEELPTYGDIPVDPERRRFANFSNGFSFAPIRW